VRGHSIYLGGGVVFGFGWTAIRDVYIIYSCSLVYHVAVKILDRCLPRPDLCLLTSLWGKSKTFGYFFVSPVCLAVGFRFSTSLPKLNDVINDEALGFWAILTWD